MPSLLVAFSTLALRYHAGEGVEHPGDRRLGSQQFARPQLVADGYKRLHAVLEGARLAVNPAPRVGSQAAGLSQPHIEAALVIHERRDPASLLGGDHHFGGDRRLSGRGRPENFGHAPTRQATISVATADGVVERQVAGAEPLA